MMADENEPENLMVEYLAAVGRQHPGGKCLLELCTVSQNSASSPRTRNRTFWRSGIIRINGKSPMILGGSRVGPGWRWVLDVLRAQPLEHLTADGTYHPEKAL